MQNRPPDPLSASFGDDTQVGDLPRVAVGVLGGDPRQGKVGVGWATLAGVRVAPAPSSTLTLADLDATIDRIASMSGPGSAGAREAAWRATLGPQVAWAKLVALLDQMEAD